MLEMKRIKEQQEAEEHARKPMEAEFEELQKLLDSKEKGEEVDEARLYELDLLHKQRRGEDLTDDELLDLQLLEILRTEKNDVEESGAVAEAREKYDDDNLWSLRDANLTPSEISNAKRIQQHLEDQGLPISIIWSSPLYPKDLFDMSFVSHGDNSYLQDLLHQQENREAERHEECLEEALEL